MWTAPEMPFAVSTDAATLATLEELLSPTTESPRDNSNNNLSTLRLNSNNPSKNHSTLLLPSHNLNSNLSRRNRTALLLPNNNNRTTPSRSPHHLSAANN